MFLTLEWYYIVLISIGVVGIGLAKLYAFKKMKDKKQAQEEMKQKYEDE